MMGISNKEKQTENRYTKSCKILYIASNREKLIDRHEHRVVHLSVNKWLSNSSHLNPSQVLSMKFHNSVTNTAAKSGMS
jgi:hypothetical protein